MLPAAFYNHLEREALAPVYLFKGDADFLMEEAWSRLVAKVVPAGARRFNGERIFARDCSAGQVTERLHTMPMFGKKNLLMIEHIEAWPKDQWTLIQSYAGAPSHSSCLVLTTGNLKGVEKLEAALGSSGIVVEFRTPSERDTPVWLQERAKHHGKKLSPRAAGLLAAQVGAELHKLEREMEKLVAYVGGREVIEPEDVKEVVGLQRSFSVFELLRFISRRQSSRAVSCLRGLMLSGEPPLGVLALMARQVRQLWQIKGATERGSSPQQITREMRLPAFVVKDYVQQVSSFSEEQLYHIHGKLRDADLALKSTRTSPEMILEELILDLCRS